MLGEGAAIPNISAIAGGGTCVSGWVFFYFIIIPILLLPIGVGRPAEVFAAPAIKGPFFFLVLSPLEDARGPFSFFSVNIRSCSRRSSLYF
jgi:hypothetical protein